jgi:hypothetical protein
MNRRILNLDAISDYLKDRGVSHEIHMMEDMSFRDQVRMFSLNATAILATHGNALGNSFWMPYSMLNATLLYPDSLVFEAHSYQSGSAWFQHIFGDMNKEYGSALDRMQDGKETLAPWSLDTSGKGIKTPLGHKLRYNVLKCKREECSADGRGSSGFNNDVRVELDRLDALLDIYI